MRDLGGYFARYGERLYKSNAVAPSAPAVPLIHYGDDVPDVGFEKLKDGVWRRRVPRSELTEYYRLEYRCMYRNLDCSMSREEGDDVEVLYLAGNSYAAAEAGMKEIDRGVFQAWVPRSELEHVQEVRTPA
ncbi:MAG TPA: hypothetical protein VGD67_21305 [Pseudonocardiaceae bacterium]